MIRFQILPCVEQSQLENPEVAEYDGMVLPLISEANNNCVLFFPVVKEIALTVNSVLGQVDKEQVSNENVIEIYKTMIDTWAAAEQFLSGIIMDTAYDNNLQEEIVTVSLILSSIQDGYIEAIVKVNFVHAIMIAVLEGLEIMISLDLLNKIMPNVWESGEASNNLEDSFPEQNNEQQQFPVDQNILDIAKKIMGGKIK